MACQANRSNGDRINCDSAFEGMPTEYITGIAMENGIAYPPFEISLRKVVNEHTI